jgi:KDO2-lipid IV(A) lauroyltransferase
MKTKSGPIAWLQYVAIRTVFAIMQAFPIEWNLCTARLLARIWVWVTPRHRDLAVAHLTASLGDRYTPAQIKRIAHRCLESVAMFAVEVVCLPRLVNKFTWTRYIRLVDFEEVLRIILSGRGAILVTGHYGSFELTGHLLATLGFDVAAVMRPLDNVHFNRFLVQTRRTHGLNLLDKKGAMETAEGVLEQGALLAFIGDQDAGRKGLFVDFFGRAASAYKSIALLAMSTGAPIIVGYVRRRDNSAAYDIGVQRIIYKEEWQGQDNPLRWITQTYTSAIETIVRAEPEQYLWIHRRWKSRPRNERAGSPPTPGTTLRVAQTTGERPDS